MDPNGTRPSATSLRARYGPFPSHLHVAAAWVMVSSPFWWGICPLHFPLWIGSCGTFSSAGSSALIPNSQLLPVAFLPFRMFPLHASSKIGRMERGAELQALLRWEAWCKKCCAKCGLFLDQQFFNLFISQQIDKALKLSLMLTTPTNGPTNI